MTKAEDAAMALVRETGKRVSNWGRWGPEDERGTLNHITPEAVKRAAACVHTGRVFSLALPLDENGPMDPAHTGRFNPIHKMTRYRGDSADGTFFPHHRSCDDLAIIPLQSSTQWDALAHVWYDDQLYNGFPADAINAGGAGRCSIANLREGVAGRAILADVAGWMGVDVLPDRYGVTPDEIDAVLKAQGTELSPGDILLVRTGCLGRWQRDRTGLGVEQPGLDFTCADWLHDNRIAAVAADNMAVERITPGPGQAVMGLHMVSLRDMGLTFGELFVLDALAADCAADGIYEMMLAAPPLFFPRAVGSPINPLAIK